MPRANGPIFFALAATVGVTLLVGTLEWTRRHPSVAAPATTSPAVRPGVLQVTDAVRSLKLITWQFETTISAESVSDKWYGDAVASVRAPVRYQYGVDLEKLRREDVLFDEQGAYTFIVPPPQRMSVEVDLKQLEQSLHVSGARWRSNNVDQIEAARRRLASVAEQSQLSADDTKRLREASREQIEKLLGNVLGAEVGQRIKVRFAE